MEVKAITKTITKTVYIANDGTEFEQENRCIDYESEKNQQLLEKECEEKMGIKIHSNFPAMINLRYDHEYKLFLIKNEQDLDLFIKTYEYWFTKLATFWEVNKDTFNYPEVLCILDFPRGEDGHRLYRMTQLFNQFYAFAEELEQKMEGLFEPNIDLD